MIQSIGMRRFLVLLCLASICVAAILINHFFLKGQVSTSLRKYALLQEEVTKLQGEVDKMKADYAYFEDQKSVYAMISNVGFFTPQDRVNARARFDAIQKLSKIISARYEIKAASVMQKAAPNTIEAEVAELTPETDFLIIESPVTVSLSAIDDLDIYKFIYYLNYGFPGHMTITNLTVKRTAEVTPHNLKLIGTGTPPELVNATMNILWRSMIRRDVVESSNDMKVLSAGIAE